MQAWCADRKKRRREMPRQNFENRRPGKAPLLLFLLLVGGLAIAGGAHSPFDKMNDPRGAAVIVAAIGGYMLPTIIAQHRASPNRGAITALNILLGWSVIGWIVAFVWSLAGERQKAGEADGRSRQPMSFR